nr:regulator of nonsense transcripts UPF3-like isoform X1 [Tanacetum cinerariifolium]
MKGRTKVVVRHLPHTISESELKEQIDTRFSGRYNWFAFHSAKNSLQCQSSARAYIDFKQPEDVIEFAEFFNGHVFVNEKGTQFKTIVEYSPSQRVPKQCAEMQLERKEAERAGTAKEGPIITPLMNFIRQKRAAKGGPRRSLLNGRLARTIDASSSSSNPSSAVLRRGSERRRRTPTTMYVPRDNGIGRNGKEKSTYVQIYKRDDQLVSEEPDGSSAATGSKILDEARGASDIGKKKILLLKGKEKEIPHLTSGLSSHQSSSSVKLSGFGVPKQNQQQEASGRIIRSILVKKDACQSRPEQQNQAPNRDMDRRPPRYSNVPPLLKDSNDLPDDKVSGHDVHGFYCENQDKRTRNKDRPDRGVWTPLRHSDGSYASDKSLSSLNSQSTLIPPDSAEGTQKKGKYDLSNTRGWDYKPIGSGRGGNFSVENGSYKHGDRRGPSYNATKDAAADGSPNLSKGKHSKRVTTGYSSHEKQVWVQKSRSGS